MTGEVEGQAAEALAERTFEYVAPGAGGAGVPVYEDDGPFGALALPERDLLAVHGDLLLVHHVIPFPLRALTILCGAWMCRAGS